MKRPTAAAAIAAALLLSACAGPDEPAPAPVERVGDDVPMNPDGAELVPRGGAGAPRGPLPAAADVDSSDADAVADAVAVTNFVVDTRVDRSPFDGLRRAAPWLTRSYAAAIDQPVPSTGGRDWNALAAADGYTTARATPSDETQGGKQDGSKRLLTRIVTVTKYDADNKKVGEDSVGVVLTLTRASTRAPWRVDAITTI